MEMPKPGPAQEKLKVMIGEWRGSEKMHPSPWMPGGGVRDAKISNRLALDGFAIIQDYAQIEGGRPAFQGHAVVIGRPHGEGYQMYWFDVFSPSVFEGTFDGEKGVFTSNSPMGTVRASWDYSKRGFYSFKMEASQDGKNFAPMMEGEYQKA